MQSLRDYYISRVEKEIPDAILNGDRSNRLPGNANFSFKGVDGGDLLLKLDENVHQQVLHVIRAQRLHHMFW